MPRKIEISHRTIVFILALLLAIKFVSKISDIIIMLFVSYILMSALNPLVDRLEKVRIPRVLSILIIYIVLWGAIGTVIASLVPSLISQTRKLLNLLPTAVSQVEFFSLNQQDIGEQFLARVGSLPENILKISIGLFSNLINLLTTLVITFYLLLYHRHLGKYLSALVGHEHHSKITSLLTQVERRLGNWVRGEILLMFSVGTLTYIGLVLLGVDIALPLAILAGVLEILPNIGPIVSSVPAVLIALTIHPFLALSTAALYFLVQFLENNLLVPKIMQKAIGTNPIVSIVSLMIGFRLAGPMGAILALPIIITIHVIGLEFFSLKHLENLSEKV